MPRSSRVGASASHLLHADARKAHHRVVGPFDAAGCVQYQHHLLGARCDHRKPACFDFTLAQLALGPLPLCHARKLGTDRLDEFEQRIGRLDAMIAVELDERGDVAVRHHRNHDTGLQTGRQRNVEPVPVGHARQVGDPVGHAGQIGTTDHVTRRRHDRDAIAGVDELAKAIGLAREPQRTRWQAAIFRVVRQQCHAAERPLEIVADFIERALQRALD